MSNETRTAVYGVFTAVLGLLAVLGYVNAEDQSQYIEAGAQTLAAVSSLMAAVKTWKQRPAVSGKAPAE